MNQATEASGALPDALHIQSLNLEAQGVAHDAEGRVLFVDGALPRERVRAKVWRRKARWQAAHLVALERASPLRVTEPPCPHFGLHAGSCGGCKMQHLHPAAQVAIKQRVLEDDFWHLARLRPETILPPVHGPSLGYRFRARLSVRFVARKGRVLIGFHERNSRYIADMQQCRVLPAHVSRLLPALQEFMASLGARESCPQIELACTDAATALVLRHLLPLTAQDLERLAAFAAAHRVQWWLQAKGPDSAHPLCPDDAPLSYSLPEFGLNLAFRPTDFTQVNPFINQVLVSRALRLLDVRKDESVIDWFCGLGNFSLALATRAGRVLGVEGSAALVRQAQGNYEANVATGTALAPTTFALDNLFEASAAQLLEKGWVADKWLIDPPREGAFALCKALADLHQDGHAHALPRRVVYVSCNPATLARDAGLLVHRAGYRCTAAGVVNMFPHTAHVESVAAFERSA